KEGVLEEDIFVTGNTGIDSLKKQIDLFEKKEHIKKTVIISIHRRENIQKIKSIIQKVFKYIVENVDWNFVWIENIGFKIEDQFPDLPQNLTLSKTLSYLEMINLYLETAVLLTDSGTMQEEACYLQIPTILIRNKSERYNDVTNQITQFFNSDKTIEKIIDEFNEKENIRSNTFYGNGFASQKIISILEKQIN
ncbi:MAG: UDP-N-acetylglucosamine 2-epimerase, partial [Fluviicola sp.]